MSPHVGHARYSPWGFSGEVVSTITVPASALLAAMIYFTIRGAALP